MESSIVFKGNFAKNRFIIVKDENPEKKKEKPYDIPIDYHTSKMGSTVLHNSKGTNPFVRSKNKKADRFIKDRLRNYL